MAVLLNTSLLAGIFHKFPHLDFNFYNTTSIFTPDSISYQQALLFNGIYLLFTSVVLFLIFSFYFLVCSCYFCTRCRPLALKPRPSKSKCLRLLICFFAVLSCSALGIAFYANNKTQCGIEDLSESASNIYGTFDFYKFKNVVIDKFVYSDITVNVNYIEDTLWKKFNKTSNIVTLLANEINNVNLNLEYATNLIQGADVNLKSFASIATDYDSYRWWMTLCGLLWHSLTVLVVIYSTYINRRCPFAVLTLMAVLSLFFMSCIISVGIPISIAAADLCRHPRKAILQYAEKQPSKDVLAHYIDCANASSNHHLTQPYSNMSDGLRVAEKLAAKLNNDIWVKQIEDSQKYIGKIQAAIHSSDSEIHQLVAVLGCTDVNQNFRRGIYNVCNIILDGLGLLILSTVIMALLLTMILLCVTTVWKAMTPLRPILKRDKFGVHLVTNSYQGPPGGSESFHGSSSFDVSYKSIDDPEEFEHVPLISKRERPPSYRTILGSTEFLSVEEDRRSKNDDGERVERYN